MSPAAFTQQEATASDSTTLDQLPMTLDSSDSKLVYLYLATVEETSIDDLQATLDLQQLALFPTLKTLESEGLIERDGETFTLAA